MTGFFKLNMYKNETLGNMTARYYYIKTLRNEVDCKEFLDESLGFLRCVWQFVENLLFSGVYQYRYHFTKSTLKRCQTWSIHSWWRWVPYWQRISDFIGLCDWKGTNSPSVSFEKSLSTMGWIEAQNIFQVCVLVPQWSNGQLWHWTWHNCVYI